MKAQSFARRYALQLRRWQYRPQPRRHAAIDSLSKQAAEPVGSAQERFAVFIKAEMAKLSAVIKTAGLEASQ